MYSLPNLPHCVVLVGLALIPPGLLHAQASLATGGQEATLPAAPATDALPTAPAAQPDAFAAWNQMLRDVARMGVRAAGENNSSSAETSPMDAPMPGDSTSLSGMRGRQEGDDGMHAGAGHHGAMGGPRGDDADGQSPAMASGTHSDMSPGGGMHRGGGMGFQGSDSGMGAMQSDGLGGAPGGRMGGRPGGSGSLNLGSLFQLAGDAGRGLSANGHTAVGSALGMVPGLTGSGLNLPMASSVGNFRFSYQSPLSFTGMNGTQLAVHGYGSGVATYDSPHARSGRVDFSASAMMGMGTSGSAAGMSTGGGGAGMGHGGGPGGGHGGPGSSQSQPSAAVSLHLSF